MGCSAGTAPPASSSRRATCRLTSMRRSTGMDSCSSSYPAASRRVTAGEDAYSAGTVSTVGMVIGALGLAGGVALWVTAPKAAATEVAVGPGSLQVKGAW